MDGDGLSIYDYHRRTRDSCFVAFARQWRVMSRSCKGLLRRMPDFDVRFFCHATEVEYVRHMRKILRPHISSHSDVGDLSCCSLSRPFCLFKLIREVDEWI